MPFSVKQECVTTTVNVSKAERRKDMFTHQIIATLDNGTEVKLPLDIKLIPYWYSSTSYIPQYMVEGEVYGGPDYDEGIIYEDEYDKIVAYLKENYGFSEEDDGLELRYEIEDRLSDYDLSMDFFTDNSHFQKLISELLDKSLSDEAIERVLQRKDFLSALILPNAELGKYKSFEEMEQESQRPHFSSMATINYSIDLSETDNCWLAVHEYKEEK